MENIKVSKKALRSLLKETLEQSIGHLELPKPNKKVKKLINRTTRKMAAEFAYLLKKEFKHNKPKKEKKAKIEAPVTVPA
jgi:hypothetical protein